VECVIKAKGKRQKQGKAPEKISADECGASEIRKRPPETPIWEIDVR